MKKLYLITDNFPFGKGEKSFIVPELNYLTQKFEVTIISTSIANNQTTEINRKIRLMHYNSDKVSFVIVKHLLSALFSKDMAAEVIEIVKANDRKLNRIIDSLKFYVKSELFYKYLLNNDLLADSSNSLFYFYWSNEKLFSICKNRQRHPKIQLITRVHGYDLYNERNRNGRLPFRRTIDKEVDRIVFASEFGINYYLKSYEKELNEKYQLFRLGVINDFGMAKYGKREHLTIVSCSNVIPIKRVDLIVRSLSVIDNVNIHWIHFGDGTSFEEIKRLAVEQLQHKENITYELKGYVDYQEIHKFYQENVVDCFITTSSTEGGAPVSIQEAMSYGIPIIGTSVGGITEMIDGNGILLNEVPTLTAITDSIKEIACMNFDLYISYREKSRKIWEKEYNADINCKLFVDYISEL